MSYEVPSQPKPIIEEEYQSQRAYIRKLRDEIFEIIGDDGKRFKEVFRQVARKHNITSARYVYLYNEVGRAVRKELNLIEKKRATGTLGQPTSTGDEEPLFHHPVLGPNQ